MKRAARVFFWVTGHAITAALAALFVAVAAPGDARRLSAALSPAPSVVAVVASAPEPAPAETLDAASPADRSAEDAAPAERTVAEDGREGAAELEEAPAEVAALPPIRARAPSAEAPAAQPSIAAPPEALDSAPPEPLDAALGSTKASAAPPQPPSIAPPPSRLPAVELEIEEAAASAAASGDEAVIRSAAAGGGGDALCGDARLIGALIGAITDDTEPLCGAPEAVEISGVRTASGVVALKPAAAMRCEMATRFADWTERTAALAASPAYSDPLAALAQNSGYSCRRRAGGGADAPISEHGRANAVDIFAFSFASGRVLTVRDGWRAAPTEVESATQLAAAGDPVLAAQDAAQGASEAAALQEAAFLRAAWETGCALFGTTLGPEADAAHADHFHFDAAARRSPFCQ